MDYETLRLVWWLILGVLLIGFAIMDGFDFGIAALLRVLGRSDSTQSMVFWMLTMTSLFALALGWREWAPLRSEDWSTLCGLGVFGALGQYALTDAFQRADASRIAPLEYTALVWGIALDYALWHTLPDAVTLSGAAVIIAAGLYLIRREHQKHVV